MPDTSRQTEESLFRATGLTRSDLMAGLRDFGKSNVEESSPIPVRIRDQEESFIPVDEDEPVATVGGSAGFIDDSAPSNPMTPPPTPGNQIAVTGVLNGVAATAQVFATGDPIPL